MEWSPQQVEAIALVREWLAAGDPQVFRLFGYAGTGKTTIIRHIVEEEKGLILFAAFTGKAASVMRKHGIPASTIHQMIYNFEQPDTTEYRALQKEFKESPTDKLRDRLRELRQPRFVLNWDSNAAASRLIVLDEVSMVYEEMGRDLESFDVPILVLGDPGQLPPIKGTGYFTDRGPSIMLTEIHRQAEGNPIITLATKTRRGQPIPVGKYGSSRIIERRDWNAEEALAADQILVGKHRTRRAINGRVRRLKGFDDIYPVVGEKLICLRNDHKKGLLNGVTAKVLEVAEPEAYSILVKLEMEDGREVECEILRAHFDEYEQEGAIEEFETTYPFWVRKNVAEFDFGYAITVHKAQGSQWDHVTLVDDRFGRDPETRQRWLYTAITRAAETITIVR